MESPKCSILAIGTELTLGQITNRNSSWIAKELHGMGFTTPWHRAVPDDRELILRDFKELSERSEVLFITGGLGPTTDDFTRDCVADWLGRPLQWDEHSWTWIVERFHERGLPLREFQKQQCFYPTGASILHNQVGTAHGFAIELSQTETQRLGRLRLVFVLPGPPAEVDNVFQKARPLLRNFFPVKDPLALEIWDCLGIGESELAHRVEAVLIGCPFEKAYRAHLPYVEFKLIYPESRTPEAQVWIKRVEEVLGELTALRHGEDASENLVKALKERSPDDARFVFVDELSGGALALRLVPAFKKAGLMHRTAFLSWPALNPGTQDWIFHLKPLAVDRAEIQQREGLREKVSELQSPYRSTHLGERQKQFFIEKAILAWSAL